MVDWISDRETGKATGAKRHLRLARLARIANYIAAIGGIAIAAYCAWLPFDHNAWVSYLRRDVEGVFVEPTELMLWMAYLLSLIPAGLFLVILVQARIIFSHLEEARLFDPEIPASLGRIGRLAIAIAVSTIILRTLVVLAMTSANPPDQHVLLISFTSTDFASLFIGVLLLAFAMVMQEALLIEAENRSFV